MGLWARKKTIDFISFCDTRNAAVPVIGTERLSDEEGSLAAPFCPPGRFSHPGRFSQMEPLVDATDKWVLGRVIDAGS